MPVRCHIDSPAPPPDTVRDLGFAECFLVWAMRTWVEAGRSGCHGAPYGHAQLSKGFRLAGMPRTHPVFDRAMTLVVVSLRKPVLLHIPCCPAVSRDEAVLLHVFGEIRSGRDGAAERALGRLLKPAGVRLVLPALIDLCADLSNAGIVPRRYLADPIRRQEPEYVGPGPGVTIH